MSNNQRDDGDVAGNQHSTAWDWSVNAWLSVTSLLAESDCNFGGNPHIAVVRDCLP